MPLTAEPQVAMAKGGKPAFASGRAPTNGWLMMNAMVFLPEIHTLFGRKSVLTRGATIGRDV